MLRLNRDVENDHKIQSTISLTEMLRRLQPLERRGRDSGKDGCPVFAASNPLRPLKGDAQSVADVLKCINTPVVLVGHCYGARQHAAAKLARDGVGSVDISVEGAGFFASKPRAYRVLDQGASGCMAGCSRRPLTMWSTKLRTRIEALRPSRYTTCTGNAGNS